MTDRNKTQNLINFLMTDIQNTSLLEVQKLILLVLNFQFFDTIPQSV